MSFIRYRTDDYSSYVEIYKRSIFNLLYLIIIENREDSVDGGDKMNILAHRGYWNTEIERNSLLALRIALEKGFGFESDVRDYKGKLVISHNIANESSPDAEEVFRCLAENKDRYCFAVNIKADGLKGLLMEYITRYQITNYFLFDMSVPQMVEFDEMGLRCFTRQSEVEPIPCMYDRSAGIWIDGFWGTSWITEELLKGHIGNGKEVCIVSPDLHGDDALLFTGEHCLDHPLPWNMKSYAYIDRALGPLIRMKADCQPGVERYLRKYEKNDKLSLSCLNACFTANEWSRKYIIDNYGLPKEKIINVGIGINVPLYLGEKDYSNPDILIVLRKGTEKYKGLDLLLEAFKLAQKRMPDLTLHVVGTDYEKVSGVKYYYNRPRSVTIDLFKKCSLYAMPAILEPMGITYLEALANKTPILGLNRFAFPELCGYGKYGFIVPVATPESVSEQIVKAFSNPNKLEKMGLEGQQMVMKRYSWSKVADKMLKTMMEDMVEV